jgi:hypothetical protein
MIELDSEALAQVNKFLGVSSPAGMLADFDDQVLQQTLDVGALIRRARTPALSEGIFTCRLANTHAGAGSIVAAVDPYDPATATPANFEDSGYLFPVDSTRWDVWLLGWTVLMFGLTHTNVTGTVLSLIRPAARMAFAVGATTPTTAWEVLHWSNSSEGFGSPNEVAFYSRSSNDQYAFPRAPIRLHRGDTIQLRSYATGASANPLQAHLTLGLFPRGSGQDAK